jgi:hypothetical protein
MVDVELELVELLLGLVGPAAEIGRLARLGEEQKDQQRQADDGGETGLGTHRVDEVLDREGVRDRGHGLQAQSKGG